MTISTCSQHSSTRRRKGATLKQKHDDVEATRDDKRKLNTRALTGDVDIVKRHPIGANKLTGAVATGIAMHIKQLRNIAFGEQPVVQLRQAGRKLRTTTFEQTE